VVISGSVKMEVNKK